MLRLGIQWNVEVVDRVHVLSAGVVESRCSSNAMILLTGRINRKANRGIN